VIGRDHVLVGHGHPLESDEELGFYPGRRGHEEDPGAFATGEVVDLLKHVLPGVPVDPDGDVGAGGRLDVPQPGVHS
jgi:hypothetical protein